MNARTRILAAAAAFALAAGVGAARATDATVTITSPAGAVSKTLPGGSGTFALDVPLAKNAVNRITVAAADDLGHSATRELSITQVSLDSIVVAQVTTERLSPEEIEQLVADGVIELDDPENYNVSVFTIVITVEGEPVRIEVPVAIPIAEEDAGGEANLPMPDADNAGGVPRPAPQEIVIFEDLVPSPAPGQPPVSIPGVLVIEGRIKSLKEFFAVRLLLMNTSGIFTLSDVTARIEFPDGGLSSVMPQSGTVGFGDILPGDGATPGQAEREFIVRGDEIGVRPLRVAFGGHLTGPGIPDDEPIPFNGDANASLEVKGPPTFLVQVHHPPRVSAGEVYDLKIDITNTGETPALYASLDLDTGADAEIVECTTDDETGEPDCAEIDGPVTRALGHVLVGQSVSQTFTLRSTVSGRIGSCLAVADQNIQLQVLVGNSGCLVGQFPPEEGAPAGIPTATVLPLANMMGVSTQSPVTAFFSELMDEVTITTGEGGSFQVFANGTSLVPGTLRFDEIFGRTVAIWQVNDGATNRLRGNTEYAVRLTQAIEDREGNPLFGEWVSTFTTTGDLLDDVTAPELTLTVLPPVDPNRILPGQLVRVDAYAADQGSGVARVEARLKDVDVEGALYELIDQKTVFEGDEPPYVFAIDSATLVPGHAYQLLVTAYDAMANGRDATVSLVMAQSASAPVIRLPDDPAEPVLHGISLDVTPVEVGEAVREVRFYLDGAADPFKTVTLAPFQASVGTIDLGLGPHSVRAVAVDGLDQSGSDRLEFELADNPNMPVVDFAGAVDGTRYVAGTNITIDGDASDPVGIRSVLYFLDQPSGTPIASGTQPFLLGTADLSLGAHRVYAVATNLLGVSNDVADPASSLEFQVVAPPTGNPPPAPLLASVSPPSDAGIVTVGGSSVPGAHVELTNLARGLTTAVDAAADGSFGATIPGAAGETLSAVAYDYAASLDPSPASTAVIPAAPVLERIEVAPAALHFTAAGEFADLVVTGHYDSGATENLTSRASYGTSDAGVATVGGSGRVVAHASGEATITARFGDQESPCAVSVAIVTLSFITVEPPEIVFQALDQTQQLTVLGHYSDGATETLASGNAFSTADRNVAVVDSAGLVRANGRGATTVTVSHAGAAPVGVAVTVDTDEDTLPTAEILSPVAGAGVNRGEPVSVTVEAEDRVGGVRNVTLDVSGETTWSDLRQVTPPELSTTEVFTFNVSESATIGGDIHLDARAEDTGGQLSSVHRVTLRVVDTVAPAAETTAPLPEAEFGPGETVVVTITATDAVGVDRIRYATSGAVEFADSEDLLPATSPASATFEFVIPDEIEDPDVWVHGFARDAAGNEGEAPQVHVTVVNDVTPPATRVTAVSDPGAAASATVSYEVQAGLSDLDHVELYFRRDGIGTFNRYTDADHGNPRGLFHPAGNGTGNIAFDSTKMGGDGTYEFYSVGVDRAGNREPAPLDGEGHVVADRSQSFAAGTPWVVISTPTLIGAGDATYEDRNLRIAGTTVTVDGHHEFRNVELLGGAVLTHPETDLTKEYGLDVTAWSLSIDAASSIDVGGCGYLGGGREGNDCTGQTLGNVDGSEYRAGGSYGGPGGTTSGTPAPVYGLITDPVDLGSGGGCSDYGYKGGDGGGRVLLHAINVASDGRIGANGANGTGYDSGAGSGGAIKLLVTTLSGTGTISANGGGVEVGGGGGRVAIEYTDVSTLDPNLVRALGGVGNRVTGGNGTVCLRDVNSGNGTLVFDGQGNPTTYTPLVLPPGYTFDNIVLRNQARVLGDEPIVVNDSLEVLTGSILTHSTESEAGLSITARRVKVDETSAIDVSSRGYRGGGRDGNTECPGLTLGGLPGAPYRAGASYGGHGSAGSGHPPNPPYGHPAQPVYLGSGGGCSDYGYRGGNGGGRVQIDAGERVVVNGAIRADGGAGGGYDAGSGSGGSIRIDTSLLMGTGAITATGGGNEVGASGGRIVVTFDHLGPAGADLEETRAITAYGGHGNKTWGSSGTVLFRRHDQPRGDLIVDDGVEGATSQTSSTLTRIGFGRIVALTDDTLTTDGLIPTTVDGLAAIEINPNLDQQQTFTIVSNTADTITVDVSGGTRLTDVAQVGDGYAGVYRFDNVYFRRGGYLLMGDRLVVDGTLRLDENGLLTHDDATPDTTSRLDLTVGTLDVRASGRVSVDGRGYLGGGVGGSDCTGQTLGNTDGAQYRSGGSYGGLGGSAAGYPTNPIYGDQTDPGALGSGGGCSDYGYDGGDGGGWIRIHAGQVLLEGSITANGGAGQGYDAGGGSGGTVHLTAHSISGTGVVAADGGGNEVGGGGGRIAIVYDALGLAPEQVHAIGGRGNKRLGGNGTIWLKSNAQSLGDLIIDGQGYDTSDDLSPIPEGATYDNLIIRNKARVLADHPLRIAGTLSLSNQSVLYHSTGSEAGLEIIAQRVEIDATSAIDASARGYRGGGRDGNSACEGATLGALPGATYRSGGSYGGYGGESGGTRNVPYGHPATPLWLGSGGGCSDYGYDGGNGGGLVRIASSEAVVVDGAIRADGGAGSGYDSGAGSGGSIAIGTGTLEGTGTITANGGGNEVAGGGGRIAIAYDLLGEAGRDLGATRNITAFAGRGNKSWGSAGTVLLKHAGQPHGDLYVDDGVDGATTRAATPLTLVGFGRSAFLTADTLTTDGLVRMVPNGLAGLELNPNLAQEQTFTVISNTETTITVDVSGGTYLTDVAQPGDPYAGVYRFDNVFLRRGGFMVGGDRLVVGGTVRIDEYGALTHHDATLTWESHLDLSAARIEVAASGRIDADARGYLGGYRGGNDASGQTLGNVDGSDWRAGGSYGGLGGTTSGTPNPVYGGATGPAELGSGGAGSSYNYAGGDGGGWLKIRATDIVMDGAITSRGAPGSGYQSGSGSGGAVDIECASISGAGSIAADGGGDDVGGGGGRVAVRCDANQLDGSKITARGGTGSHASGQDGSVHLAPR